MLWDPLRFLESCPSSDGACAVVFTDRGRRQGGRGGRAPAGVDPRHRDAQRAVDVPGSRPGPARRAAVDCAADVYAQAGITEPPRADRRRRAVRAVQLVRADVARGPRHRRARRGLEDGRARRDRDRRLVPGQPVGRRAVVEPDRRVGAAALRRGRAPGAGHGRRAPGRRRQRRARPGLRGRGPVLRDVGRRRAPSIRSAPDPDPRALVATAPLAADAARLESGGGGPGACCWEAELLAFFGGEVVEVGESEAVGLVGVADEGPGAGGDEHLVVPAGDADHREVGRVVTAAPAAGPEVMGVQSVTNVATAAAVPVT